MSAENDWTVGIVAATVSGDVVLRMTEAQAVELRDQLVFLMSEAES